MKINKPKGEQSVYIELNGWTYYIDDSTNEQTIEKWKEPTTTTIEHHPDVLKGDLIPDIPTHPHHVYKDNGWTNWGDFLGTNTKKGE